MSTPAIRRTVWMNEAEWQAIHAAAAAHTLESGEPTSAGAFVRLAVRERITRDGGKPASILASR